VGPSLPQEESVCLSRDGWGGVAVAVCSRPRRQPYGRTAAGEGEEGRLCSLMTRLSGRQRVGSQAEIGIGSQAEKE
jgi:hypothetical protein